MLRLKTKLHLVLLLVVLVLGYSAPSASAQTSAEAIQSQINASCSGMSADAADRCATNVREEIIQSEIRRRCSGMSADAADRCATSTRQSINEGDFDYNGTPDSAEQDADPSQGASLEAECSDAGNCCEGETLDKDNCVIVGYILTITNVLSAIVGIVIVIMIAVGGLQYTAARDDPQAVSAAKNRIRNAILALVFYLFTFAFLQWLIPGGVL